MSDTISSLVDTFLAAAAADLGIPAGQAHDDPKLKARVLHRAAERIASDPTFGRALRRQLASAVRTGKIAGTRLDRYAHLEGPPHGRVV